MEGKATQRVRRFVTPEQEENIRRNKEAVKRERIRIAMQMMLHNEQDEKIALYTRLNSEELREIRETMENNLENGRARKSEAMRQGLTFQDPPRGMKSPWQYL